MVRDAWMRLSPLGVGVLSAGVLWVGYEVVQTLVWMARYQMSEEFRRKMARARDGG